MHPRSPIVDLFDEVASNPSDAPERRLMAAVLFDAVLQLARRGSKGAAEVRRWIHDGEGENTPFSFNAVCEALGLDAGYLARGLLAWDPSKLENVRVPTRRALAVPRRPRLALATRRRPRRAVLTG